MWAAIKSVPFGGAKKSLREISRGLCSLCRAQSTIHHAGYRECSAIVWFSTKSVNAVDGFQVIHGSPVSPRGSFRIWVRSCRQKSMAIHYFLRRYIAIPISLRLTVRRHLPVAHTRLSAGIPVFADSSTHLHTQF